MWCVSHLPRINAGVIALLSDPRLRALISPPLLDEFAQSTSEKYRGTTAARIDDILFMQDEIKGGEKPRKYAGQEQVTAHHEELVHAFSKHRLFTAFKPRFSRPPLPGTQAIVPVRTPADLAAEGREQSNCVASCVEDVLEGDCYIYRVLQPERATLSITRNACGDWEIDQLLLSRNRMVSPATLEQVEAWLDKFAISA